MARDDIIDPKEAERITHEREVANTNWAAYVRSRDNGHQDYIREARLYDNYYRGEQWEKDTTDALNAAGRPWLTINQVLSTVNSVIGTHVNTRQEIAFRPRGRGATDEVADALTHVVKQIQDANRSRWIEQNVVNDGLVEDRGYFDIRMDFSDNIQGEIRETALDPRDVLLDPGAKEYDPSTWKEVIVTRWLTPDEISVTYGPTKAEMLRIRTMSHSFGSDSVQFEVPTATYGSETNPMGFTPGSDDDDKKVKRVRVIERQHKVLARTQWFVDPIEGDKRRVPGNWSEPQRDEFAERMELGIIEQPEQRIRWTVSADDVTLFDEWSLYDQFTVIPFFPFFRRGRPIGLVRNLVSPQDMLNKIASQELHVVNTTANSGWIFESGSLVNKDADDLEKEGAQTGLVLEFQKGSTAPAKIEPNRTPTGLAELGSKAQLFFRLVSGIPEEALGFSSHEVSGVAVQTQANAASTQIDVIWDNLAKARQWRGEFILKLIQNYYTETRIIRITSMNDEGEPQAEELAVNQPGPEEVILNDLTLGEYATIVTSVPHAESMQDSIFSQSIQMREAGVAIPDHVLIENSRLPNRNEIAEEVKRLQGMAEPTEQEVEQQLMIQDIQMRTMEANLQEIMAKVAERQANAMLNQAKAVSEGARPDAEAEKFGAEISLELQKLKSTMQANREDLAARMLISREKNDSTRFVAQVESMAKRLGDAGKNSVDLKKIAATPAPGSSSGNSS